MIFPPELSFAAVGSGQSRQDRRGLARLALGQGMAALEWRAHHEKNRNLPSCLEFFRWFPPMLWLKQWPIKFDITREEN